ncbi:MAG: DUF6429 family protein [Pseudomonadota bacterium]|nr:DUF6429 family protein [Pseudomonadota bacterium]
MPYDQSQIDDAVLALLAANVFDTNSAWKGYDFEVMSRLHEAGYIFDPVGKQKTVQLTQEGISRGQELADRLFGSGETSGPGKPHGA